MIDGVVVKKINLIPDERGWLQEILRCDDEIFTVFGQVYFTTTYPGVVKGWHSHKEQTDFVVCIKGMIKLVLYDDRAASPTHNDVNELFIGELMPRLVKIPNGVVHGWKCISPETSYIINIPDKPYNYDNPDEFRINPFDNDIPYNWKIKEG